MATGGWCAEVQHPSPYVFRVEWLTLTHPLLRFPPAGLSFPSHFSPFVSSLLSDCISLPDSVSSQQYYFFTAFSLICSLNNSLGFWQSLHLCRRCLSPFFILFFSSQQFSVLYWHNSQKRSNKKTYSDSWTK